MLGKTIPKDTKSSWTLNRTSKVQPCEECLVKVDKGAAHPSGSFNQVNHCRLAPSWGKQRATAASVGVKPAAAARMAPASRTRTGRRPNSDSGCHPSLDSNQVLDPAVQEGSSATCHRDLLAQQDPNWITSAVPVILGCCDCRSSPQDQTCRALIDPRSSGYCECGGGRIIRKPGCVHGEWAEPFTCLDECAGQPLLGAAGVNVGTVFQQYRDN